jgi:L-ascorbate metabolism protein UlaG (beta-lactamase superfamily)
MKLTFLGHSCVLVEHGEHRLIIDPFLTGNPVAAMSADEVKVDYILVTHGHGDHLGDTVEIAKRNDATVIANYELATYLSWQGLKTHEMHIGGSFSFPFGKVKLTPALHGTGLAIPEKKEIVYLGMPTGLLITIDGKTIYHAGDTGLFSDMKLIGERNSIDVAFLPIGDNYTMGPEDALLAAEWIGAKQVIPMHYSTWPPIDQDAYKYVQELGQRGIQGVVLKPGDNISL